MSLTLKIEKAAWFDILLSLKEEDSYGAQLGYRRVASESTFDLFFSNLSPGTHVESFTCRNLLYEIAISSRIDITKILLYYAFKNKRHVNPALKDRVCTCPIGSKDSG